MTVAAKVVAVILAGGRGSRMAGVAAEGPAHAAVAPGRDERGDDRRGGDERGTDKAMVKLAGRPLIAHVFARLAPQVAAIAISANGDPARFAAFGVPVLPDPVPADQASVDPMPADQASADPMPPGAAPAAAAGPGGRFAGPLAGLLAGARWAMAAHPGALLLSSPCDVPFLPPDLVVLLRAAPLPACAASAGRLHPLLALWRPEEVVAQVLSGRAAAGGSARALLESLGGAGVAWADDAAFMNVNDPATLRAAYRSICGG